MCFDLNQKKAAFCFIRPVLIFTLLASGLLFFSSCSDSTKDKNFYIMVVHGGSLGGRPGGAMEFSLAIDGRNIVSKEKLESGAVYTVNEKLDDGIHKVTILEHNTKAMVVNLVSSDKKYWYRATFNEANGGLGNFKILIRPKPWEEWK